MEKHTIMNYVCDKNNQIAFLFSILCSSFSVYGYLPFCCSFVICCFINSNSRISAIIGSIFGMLIKNQHNFIFSLAICITLCIIWIKWLGADRVKRVDYLLILALSQLSLVLLKHNTIQDCMGVLINCLASIPLTVLLSRLWSNLIKKGDCGFSTRTDAIIQAAAQINEAFAVNELSTDGRSALKQFRAFSDVLCSTGAENNTSPSIKVNTGMACVPKENCAYTGDSVLIVEHDNNTLIALSDGMGSGLLAHNESSAAVNAFAQMCIAGFSLQDSIDAVNRRLIAKNSEDFYATLDSCIINCTKSYATFVKMGSPQTCLLRNNRVINITSEALPLGIIETVNPTIKELSLKANDVIIQFTDGVTDALGMNLVANIIDLSKTHTTPGSLANALLDSALSNSARDDMSIVCAFITTI